MNSPPQLLIPTTAQKKSRFLFSPADGFAVATLLSAQHTQLPQARSDSSLTHTWKRNLFPALGSAEEERAQKSHQGKAPTRPNKQTKPRWTLSGHLLPYSSTLLLQHTFPRKKSHAMLETYPCRSRIWREEREALHAVFFL